MVKTFDTWVKPAALEFRSQITGTVTSYFRLWDFLSMRMEHALGADIHSIGDEDAFWSKLAVAHQGPAVLDIPVRNLLKQEQKRRKELNKKLFYPFEQGDQLNLKGLYLSDWIPRIPGELWMQELFAKRESRGEFTNFGSEYSIPPKIKSWIQAYEFKHPR